MEEPYQPYAVLAEILVSRKIGLTHVHLVGELVVAKARLNMWLQNEGKKRLSSDQWGIIVERVLECESRYEGLWRKLDSADLAWVMREGLRGLERELREAIQVINGLADIPSVDK